jgi:hypothetical protein
MSSGYQNPAARLGVEFVGAIRRGAVVVVLHRLGGLDAAVAVAKERCGAAKEGGFMGFGAEQVRPGNSRCWTRCAPALGAA